MNMSATMYLSLAVVVTALASLLAALVLKKYAVQMELLSKPDEYRLHFENTPVVGGLAIYFAVLLGYILFDRSFAMLLPCLLFLTLVGMLDDRYNLNSMLRILAQVIAAYAMIKLTGVELTSLGFLHPDKEVILGSWSTPVTVFAVVGVINAVNMSDGMDGLAGGLVVLCLAALIYANSPDLLLIMITLGAVLGFLSLNARIVRSRAKVFMGDAGSTMLGLLLAYLLIRYSQIEKGIWPVTALWFLALPLIDAVSVLIVRPLRGKSPFSADRIHYHHQLIDRGWSVNKALFLILLIQSALIALGVVAWKMRVADHLQLAVFLLLFVLYAVNVWFYARRFSSK